MKKAGRIVSRGQIVGVLAMVVATMLIVACGAEATPTPTRAGPAATATPKPTATATPQPTPTPTLVPKVLVAPRLRVVNAPDSHFLTVPYAGNQVTWSKMPEYEHLIGHNIKNYEEVPELATNWSVASDGKTWTFDLKKGVPFYKDGRPYKDYTFSAKDVILSWDLLIGERGKFPTKLSQNPARWFSLLGGPENWEVVSDYKVNLRSPKVNLDLGFNLSDIWESGILSRDHWDAVGGEEGYQADPIGTGPWTFVSRKINVSYFHKAVKNHWRKTPEFEELEMLQVPEPSTRLAMLFAKEVHMIPLVQDQKRQILSGGFKLSKSTLPSVNQALAFIYYRETSYVDPATGKPPPGGRAAGPTKGYDPKDPLRNPKVRLALNYAVNRDELNRIFYDGEAFPLVDEYPQFRSDWQDRWAPITGPEGKTGRDGGWPYPYDPAKAKQTLAEAGYPNGFETRLNCLRTHNVIPDWPGMCEAIIQYFRAVGVTTRLEIDADFGDFRNKAEVADKSNWMYGSSPGYSPICNRITFGFPYQLGKGYREFEEVDELAKVCDSATTIEERDKGAIKFGDAWYNKAFSIPLVWVFSQVAYDPGVVLEYKVNMSNFGTARYPEWVKAVYK